MRYRRTRIFSDTTIAPTVVPLRSHQVVSIRLLHADARLLRSHTSSAAIDAARRNIRSPGPEPGDRVINEFCGSNRLRPKRARERRGTDRLSMQSVAPNEFRTGWKNRWRVIYDDVYINEKCASGRRHVALSFFLRGRQSSRSPTDD